MPRIPFSQPGLPLLTVGTGFHLRAVVIATPGTVAHTAPLFMGFHRQESWRRSPFLSPRDLPFPGNEPTFLESPALAGVFFTLKTAGSGILLLPELP